MKHAVSFLFPADCEKARRHAARQSLKPLAATVLLIAGIFLLDLSAAPSPAPTMVGGASAASDTPSASS